MLTPRYYQRNAVDAVKKALDDGKKSALIELACGTGKSLIPALLALELNLKILVVVPSKELCQQNMKKFIQLGGARSASQVSYFSASMGQKDSTKRVIYGTQKTIMNHLDDGSFKDVDVVISDEVHIATSGLKKIADSIPNLKMFLGMTATPYRLNTGTLYKSDNTSYCLFDELIYSYRANQALKDGYICPVEIKAPIVSYDTSKYEIASTGDYKLNTEAAIKEAKSLTPKIITSIKKEAENKKRVMIFAQSIHHCEKIAEYFEENEIAIVHSKIAKAKREEIINKFIAGEIKYLVNQDILTTGFDCPEIDFIAIMRPTTSVVLHQQIVYRGCRLAPNKDHFVLIDYTDNLQRLYFDGDIYSPIISYNDPRGSKRKIEIKCPQCREDFKVTPKPNIDGYRISEYGYFLDQRGIIVEPNHYTPKHECGFIWLSKLCNHCSKEITQQSRFCPYCNEQQSDPDKKLMIYEDVMDDKVKDFSAGVQVAKSMSEYLHIHFIMESNTKVKVLIGTYNIGVLGLGTRDLNVAADILNHKQKVPLYINYFLNKNNNFELTGVKYV